MRPCSYFYFFIFCFILASCDKVSSLKLNKSVISPNGNTIQSRLNAPKGFVRKPCGKHSFAKFLRNLPLKPAGHQVKMFDGKTKKNHVYEAVVDMEIGKENLQQCADAVMRLRGEYLYSEGKFNDISFTLTNGFKVDYAKWIKGNRVIVHGNKTQWSHLSQPLNNYKIFRNYMEFICLFGFEIWQSIADGTP